MMDILSKVWPGMIRESHEDIDITKTICFVNAGKNPTFPQIHKIMWKPVCRYLDQYDQLVFQQGVLCRMWVRKSQVPSTHFTNRLYCPSDRIAPWWTRSSGSGAYISISTWALLLEHSPPRCYKLGKTMQAVSDYQGSIYWSKSISGVNGS